MNTFFSGVLPWLEYGLSTFVIAVAGCSFFEWVVHKYFMHKRVSFFTYPFEKHAMVHHQIFKADETYHLINEKDKSTIPMAWWNGPVMIVIGVAPVAVISYFFSDHWLEISFGALLAMVSYYVAYEYMHWCMHLPRKRSIERTGVFFRLNGHHLLHHRYMGKNFNVVFPLADLCLGTLLCRSKIHFRQACGPSVPDVQPMRPKPAPLQKPSWWKKLKPRLAKKRRYRRKIVFLEAP